MATRSKRNRSVTIKRPYSPSTIYPTRKKGKTATESVDTVKQDEEDMDETVQETIKDEKEAQPLKDEDAGCKINKNQDSKICEQQPTKIDNNQSFASLGDGGQFVFKDKNYSISNGQNNRKKAWKTLKQIIAMERSLPWKPDDPTYCSIDAPGAFLPAKKYSDISGVVAKYTDPQTKIRYATPSEFATVRSLPWDVVQGYLRLRNAATAP